LPPEAAIHDRTVQLPKTAPAEAAIVEGGARRCVNGREKEVCKKMKMITKVLVFTCAFALVPSFAHAFSGIYVECAPTAGIGAVVSVKKGLTCDEKTNKLKLKVATKTSNAFDNCNAVAGGAPWDVWSLGKWGSKITQANAATIALAELQAKGTAFGSCNLGGSPNSAGANMSGKFTFKDITGLIKVKGGKGAFVARVGADVPTQSAVLNGIVNKGMGVGGIIRVIAGLDVANPLNSDLLSCNLGFLCPPDSFNDPNNPIDPIESIALLTLSSSRLRIGAPVNSDCTGVNDPWDCCTGAGTGSCDD